MKQMFRLARRDLARHKLMAVLSAVLIAVPIAFVSVAYQQWTRGAEAELDPGVAATGYLVGPEPIEQNIDGSAILQGPTGEGDDSARDKVLLSALLESVSPSNTASIRVDDGGAVMVRRGEDYEPVFLNSVTAVSSGIETGRAPAEGEIAASKDLLLQLGIDVGDTLEVSSLGADTWQTHTIVGVSDGATVLPGGDIPVTELTIGDAVRSGGIISFVITGEEPVTWEDVQTLNKYGFVVTSRDVIDNPPPPSEVPEFPGSSSPDYAVLAILYALAVAEIVLVVTPAFTIAAKRNERNLAQLAAVGATPRHLRWVMMFQGLIVGLSGAVLGVIGYAIGCVILRSFEPEWSFSLSVVALAVLGSVILGLVAALWPAIVVGRVNVVEALSGRHVARRVSRIRWVWAPALAVIASAVAWWWSARYKVEMPALFPVAVIVAIIALALSGPAFVHGGSTLVSRISVAARVAGRDARRNMHRSGPAVATITIVILVSVLWLTFARTALDQSDQSAYSVGERGQGLLELRASDAGGDTQERLDEALARLNEFRAVAEHRTLNGAAGYNVAVEPQVPAKNRCAMFDEEGNVVDLSLKSDERCAQYTQRNWITTPMHNPAIILVDDGSLVDQFAAVTDVGAAKEALSAGGAVISDRWALEGGQVTLDKFQLSGDDADVIGSVTVPAAAALRGQGAMPSMILSPQAASELGLEVHPVGAIVAFKDPIAMKENRADMFFLDDSLGATMQYVNQVSFDAVSNALILASIATIIAIIVVIAVIILAGRAGRADLDTIDALGGPPSFRRKVSAWSALIVVLAGLLPGILAGILASLIWGRMRPEVEVTLWPAGIGVLVLILVACALAVGWAAAPRPRTLTRRMD